MIITSKSVSELLESVQKQNASDRAILESGVPMVGVFYYIDGQVYARPRSKVQLDPGGTASGVISYSTHFSYWMDLRNLKPEWRKLDDSYFPRGRVIYDKDEDLYHITMDKCIPQSKIVEVLEGFNLTGIFHQARHKIRIVHGRDPETGTDHYKCAQCDPVNRKRVL